MIARSLAFRPATLDREARTVEAVASTGAGVARRDARGPYIEVLDLSPGALDLSRLIGGPVLDAHRQTSRRDVLGVVEDARIEDGLLIVRLKLSARADGDEVLDDIEAGVLRGVSLGYRVEKWREDRAEGGARRLTAVRWAPVELSLVPVPADPGATIRSGTMPADNDDAVQDARTREDDAAEVRALAETAGVTLAEGAEPETARAAALDVLRTRTPATIRATRQDADDPAVRAAWMGEALFCRVDPAHEPSAPARQFVGMTIPDMGRDILRRAGVPTTGMAPATIITRALHTTSDFALILGDTVNRTMRARYQAAPAGIKTVARATTARDFRAKRRLQLSEAALPEKVNEHGEFKSGTLAEAEETYRVETFGRIYGISRQALINDDLGAFADLSGRMGIACAEFEAQHLVDLLTQGAGLGPTMSDGARLFHADHANIGTAGAISITTLTEARTKMRRQTGLKGEPISVTPRYLLVPPELETVAETQLATIAPTRTADVNPFAAALSVIVEPRLQDTGRWYLAASPDAFDGLEYAYLDGAPGPQIETRNGFEIDGVQIKVRLDFGAGFVDWRGWFTNGG